MTTSALGDAFAHHIWATQRLIEACESLTAEQLAMPSIGTYGPIIETLRHLVSSDRWYLSYFPSGASLALMDKSDVRLGTAELRSEMATNATAWMTLLAGEIDPDHEFVERGDDWELRSPVGVRLAQVIHHGTDHRSQICTAMTSFGIEPPEIDVWAYARASGRETLASLGPL